MEHAMSNRTHDGDPVTVLATGDPAILAIAESLLEDAGIEFVALGEGLQDFFGMGRLGGYNQVVGPVRIQVAAEDADDAVALLKDLVAP
jgi:hypothetical protein